MILRIILIIFFYNLSSSQNIQYNRGEELKDRLFLIDKKEKIVVDDNENLIAIRPHKINGTLRNYYIEFYDKLNFDHRIEVKTDERINVTTSILQTLVDSQNLYILLKEEQNEVINIKLDIINLSNSKLIQKVLIKAEKDLDKELFESIKKNELFFNELNSSYLISLAIENDKTLILHNFEFDKKFNAISKEKIIPSNEYLDANVSLLTVDIINNIPHALFVVSYNERRFYKLVRVSDNKQLKIPIKGDVFELIKTKTYQDEYVISGLYSSKENRRYVGVVYHKIDFKSFELLNQNYSPFTNKDTQNYFKGLFKSHRGVDIKDIFIDESGKTIISCQFYKYKKTGLGWFALYGNPLVASAIYFTTHRDDLYEKIYDDILTVKLDNEGKIEWENLINVKSKRVKHNQNKKDYSYFAFFDGKDLRLLINTNIKTDDNGNFRLKQSKRKSKTGLYSLTFNPEGKLSSEMIFSNDRSKTIFPLKGALSKNNKVYILGQGNMRKQALQISF